MLKQERTYYFILGVLIALFLLIELLRPTPLDWTESFSAADDIPYGGYILHELLPETFPGTDISQNQQPLFQRPDSLQSTQNWIFINTNFQLDEWESQKLLRWVENGSQVFIAARSYSGLFADTLNLGTTYQNPLLGGGSIVDDDTSYVHFSNPMLQKKGGYPFYQSTTQTYFSSTDTSNSVILGVNEKEEPIFLKINRGQGSIYLHANPTLFTNYLVRNKTGAEYALKALSYLPVQPTVWDEYYKQVYRARGSGLRYVVSQEYLKWGWFLGLSGVVLFMLFRAKRRQRIIPEIKAPKNSSIEFAQTIGSLYLEKGSHKLIADKKIQFFFDYIRSRLGLDTSEADKDFRNDVALRSGLESNRIDHLFSQIESVRSKENITPKELKQLTEAIDHFYKKSQR
ncbi:DUF4350 domain-containing protein [Gracilimonas mengyeensis]|uniref:DUF4350 domain-containing protein n=1 Tax=Gracilimonas mengyeensis TaxID=1302730 RepID=A0A521BNR1_9BACT|nr:DUF4350 domain-containing protein [Gracilimonas mengyeensis]SMO48746.1 hypothetical protein SAMN06265219_102432 [Gracilimonas mengyeensis]